MKFAGKNGAGYRRFARHRRAAAIELARQRGQCRDQLPLARRAKPKKSPPRSRSSAARRCSLQADVADQAAVEDMVAKTAAEFGSLDLFVSNAAYSDRELMIDADMDGFRRTIDVTHVGGVLRRAGGGAADGQARQGRVDRRRQFAACGHRRSPPRWPTTWPRRPSTTWPARPRSNWRRIAFA